jgi:hypothetical protein
VFKHEHIDTLSGQSAAASRRCARPRADRLGVRARMPPEPCAFPMRPRPEAPRSLPGATRAAVRAVPGRVRATDRRSVRGAPPYTRRLRPPVPRWHLRRHRDVTGEAPLYKCRTSPPPSRRHLRSTAPSAPPPSCAPLLPTAVQPSLTLP